MDSDSENECSRCEEWIDGDKRKNDDGEVFCNECFRQSRASTDQPKNLKLVTHLDFSKTPVSKPGCIVLGCTGKSSNRLDNATRVKLLQVKNIMVPYTARVCSSHLVNARYFRNRFNELNL